MKLKNPWKFIEKTVLFFFCVLLCTTSLYASQEGVIPFDTFKVESRGIGESGPVVVSGRQNEHGFESLEVIAFGKTFQITQAQLKELQDGLMNGLQLSYEYGYKNLGGRTLYLRFSKGFTSGIAKANLITINESGTIIITTIENEKSL
jgi:hypothetical protein